MAEPPTGNDLSARHEIVRATDLTGVHVLKHDNLYLLANAHGDIRSDGRGLGLYDSDTRILSTYDVLLNGLHPVVLRAGPAAGFQGTIQLTNADQSAASSDQPTGAANVLRRQSLGMVRERLVSGGFRERIVLTNYNAQPERVRLTVDLDADFADIFEVRGIVRVRRGERLPNVIEEGRINFAYRGLDGLTRVTHVAVDPVPEVINTGSSHGALTLCFDDLLGAAESLTITIEVWPDGGPTPPIDDDQPDTMHSAWRQSSTSVDTQHLLAERALARADADLRLLRNSGPAEGERYIAAGLPWFSCLFGRDSIVSSLQLLAIRPQLARSTLLVLARLQATETDDFRAAQPGKILHELRTGELARTGEIPHTPYYGSVDSTPLWLMLLDEYERWTADMELVDTLWPNVLAALRWLDDFGDVDGDGFVEYARNPRGGLRNQGWKDSPDAIRFRDGSLADGPIALVEVQAYVYAARRGVARLATLRGDTALAEAQARLADELRGRFEAAFWMDDAGTYALALDGGKRQVDAVTSNAGHALWAGIASAEHAASVARTLTGAQMWSGWGIRTLSAAMVGFNPIGYHLGTVWPHDNGICAAGFARYGLGNEARRVAGALLEATVHFREARLPELFCGFDREHSPLPVPYPVACAPQAWAAGSLFHVLTAMLGMRPAARERRLDLFRPALPEWLSDLRLRRLRVGDTLVDLELRRDSDSIAVEVLHRTGELEVTVQL